METCAPACHSLSKRSAHVAVVSLLLFPVVSHQNQFRFGAVGGRGVGSGRIWIGQRWSHVTGSLGGPMYGVGRGQGCGGGWIGHVVFLLLADGAECLGRP